jgi:hypothetical protein
VTVFNAFYLGEMDSDSSGHEQEPQSAALGRTPPNDGRPYRVPYGQKRKHETESMTRRGTSGRKKCETSSPILEKQKCRSPAINVSSIGRYRSGDSAAMYHVVYFDLAKLAALLLSIRPMVCSRQAAALVVERYLFLGGAGIGLAACGMTEDEGGVAAFLGCLGFLTSRLPRCTPLGI